MLLLGIGIGAVGAFVVMTIAACLGASFIVRVEQQRETNPLPQLDASDIQELSADEKTRRIVERHNKYLHALEAISTLNQDNTSQRIARQAIGKGWTS